MGDPQGFSAGADWKSVDNRTFVSMPEGTIDLIIFDGAFDRPCSM